MKEAQDKGYTVILVFIWLKTLKMAIGRVKMRVKSGGHDIPIEIIKRRYVRGLKNFKTFAQNVDKWIIFNNSNKVPAMIAEKYQTEKINIIDKEIFDKIINYESK